MVGEDKVPILSQLECSGESIVDVMQQIPAGQPKKAGNKLFNLCSKNVVEKRKPSSISSSTSTSISISLSISLVPWVPLLQWMSNHCRYMVVLVSEDILALCFFFHFTEIQRRTKEARVGRRYSGFT